MKMMSLSFLKFFHLAIIVLQLGLLAPTSWGATSAEVRCIESERQALLQFKAGLVDDTFDVLSSWGSDEENKRHCCEWKGLSYSNQTGHVQQLDLYGLQLQDSQILEFIGSLTNLRYPSLFDCGFKGNIPSQLGSLSQLRYLDLAFNSLEGSIPYQLGNLSNLQLLDLRWKNYFVGAIPHQLGNLSKLQELYLADIDSLKTGQEKGVGGEWLSSLTSLTHLSLSNISDLKYSHNWLQIIGKLRSLQELDLSSNDLSDHYILSLTALEFNSSNSLLVFWE
ncbi:receptor-like protein EIX2 [Senna tora]|uniref:Receptor-like protein EIX2 n=1 Tax=Senna tora TaxID=362788 RepID=A0A835CIJ0_9FABA|nr:receptor-like protein EIX2 [Senna tora]